MASELESLIDENNVTHLIVNGDVKSGIDRILETEWEEVPRFFSRLSKKCTISVVPGNHDGGLSNLLSDSAVLEDINGVLLEDTLILHGHTRPLTKFNECKRLIIGHVHPIFQRKGSPLSGQPVWAFLKMPKKLVFREMLDQGKDEDPELEVIVMPSFNMALSPAGYHPDYDGEERKPSSLAKDLRQAEEAIVVTLSGAIIGDKTLLTNLF